LKGDVVLAEHGHASVTMPPCGNTRFGVWWRGYAFEARGWLDRGAYR